ncbi:MAG: hypothetical protein ACR2QT_09025 [Woeseiaceae bacterium]
MKLLAGSVVRGTRQDDSQGGLYLIDLESQSVRQVLDYNNSDIVWNNRGREHGLRGIAFDGDTIYCVASDELFAFDSEFKLLQSWRNSYLKYCRGLVVYERKLFVVSSGFDSILGFDLEAKKFDWALQILTREFAIGAHPFDPNSDEGPMMVPKLDLRDIYCDASGMYITSESGLLRFAGRSINIAVELPPQSRNARPYRDGVLFNDSAAGKVRYAGRGEGEDDRSIAIPRSDEATIRHRDLCDDSLAIAGFARGLSLVGDSVVAAGSSPSTITVYDLAANKTTLSVELMRDARSSIHGLEVWPFD